MNPPVTIAVVSWNTRALLCRCLRSLEAEVESGRAAVIVVDNASADGSAELVRELFPWVELIASPTNLGFGAAVNLAAQRTTAPWLAAANADIELQPGALQTLLAAAGADPAAGILAPRLRAADGTTQHSVHPFPTLALAAIFNLGLPAAWPALGDRLALEGHWDPDRARRVDWAIGAFLLIRRELWDRLGGFPAKNWMYAEDVDLCWRAARAGWPTRYVPDAVVAHVGAASTEQAWGEGTQARWVRSTYGWMARTRGSTITRTYALLNSLGALGRLGLASPGALAGRREPWRELRHWSRLHLTALLSSAAQLRDQR